MNMRRLIQIRTFFLAIFFWCSLVSGAALADVIQPSLLEITEKTPEHFDVVWKVPKRGDLVLSLRPILPSEWTAIDPPDIRMLPGAMVERTSFKSDGQPVAGQTISIEGLPGLFTDVLLQIKLHDGSSYVAVLRSDVPSFTIPALHAESLATVIFNNMASAFGHLLGSIHHIVLILAFVLLGRGTGIIKTLLAFILGHAASLVLVDLGVDGFPSAIAEVFSMVVVFLIARSIVLKRQDLNAFVGPVFLVGLFHGLGQATSLGEIAGGKPELLQALFAFNTGLDLGQVILVALVYVVFLGVQRGQGLEKIQVVAGYALGIAAVAIAIATFMHALVPESASNRAAASQTREIPVARSLATVAPNRTGPIAIQPAKDPATVFLTIEPYEVRLEVLFRVQDLYALQEFNAPTENMIDPDAQGHFIEKVIALMQDRVFLEINGKATDATVQRGGFVTSGSYGILVREQKVPERADEAILGMMFVYGCDDLPNNVRMNWDLFLPASNEVSVTLVDPLETQQMMLTNTAPAIQWANQLEGFEVPVVASIPVVLPAIPVASIVLFVFFIIIYIVRYKKDKRRIVNGLAGFCLALAIILYPFVRFKLEIPGLRSLKPDTGSAAFVVDGLLTNVYRSFYLRDEGTIYDRLATTASGDQLTDIYLQVRTALEMENRGGARARVDQVKVDEVRDVRRKEDGMFAVDTVWTINGSVCHFGHTHYRQNRYHAVVNIFQDGDVWKIGRIDLLDEQRIL